MNHITKVRSRHAVKPRAVQPVVTRTPHCGAGGEKMEFRMNFRKSLKNDYYLGVCAIFSVIFLGVLVYYFVTQEIDLGVLSGLSFSELVGTSDFLVFAIFSLVILGGIVLFVKRIIYIKSFENENKLVDGKVVDITYVKDRCRVKVEYNLNGENYIKKFMLFNNKQTKYVHMDSEVKLLIRDENPKKALISELYFD